MPSSDSRPQSQRNTLAVVCFLPDAGHVLPLLRLARRIQVESDSAVTCYMPDGFAATIRQYGFAHKEVRVSGAWNASGLGMALARRTIFYSAFSNHMDLSDNYWTPLRATVSEQLGELLQEILRLGPGIILCDSHLFLDWYECIAGACGAELIVNYSEGTLRRLQRPYVHTYGLTDQSEAVQWTVETAGSAATLWFRGWRLLRYASRRRSSNSMQRMADQRAHAMFQPYQHAKKPEATYVSAGLAALEDSLDGVRRSSGPKSNIVLPPTIMADDQLSDSLQAWLHDQEPGKVIYVCFGTMVSLSPRMAAALIQGLMDAGMPVLWSLPASQREVLAGYRLAAKFRVEDFVAQRALLASDRVGCFVTHGGAGSTQEAVLFGKPVLCIPFMWDQPYNCSILQRLGVARKLSKRNLSRRRVASALQELIVNPRYADAARRIAKLLAERQNAERGKKLLSGSA